MLLRMCPEYISTGDGLFWVHSESYPDLLFCTYIHSASTHSVYIAKPRISHLSDPLCMQLYLSYLHTNVSCSFFHSVPMAEFTTQCKRNTSRIQVPKRGKMSVIANTVVSFRKTSVVVYLPYPSQIFHNPLLNCAYN